MSLSEYRTRWLHVLSKYLAEAPDLDLTKPKEVIEKARSSVQTFKAAAGTSGKDQLKKNSSMFKVMVTKVKAKVNH